jgi:hypothetical protein
MMKAKSALFIVLITNLLLNFNWVAKTEASDWKYYASSEKGADYYYDAESIDHSSAEIVRVWIKIVKREIERSKHLLDVNCREQRGLLLTHLNG